MNNHHPYQSFRLSESFQGNSATKILKFDQPLNTARPGQFVMVWLPEIGEKPFSILNDAPFSLAVTSIGPFSSALHHLSAGSRIWVRGPFGQGFKLDGHRHLLVGGGYGAAPLYFLARQARSRDDEVQVCLGARSKDGILLADDFKNIGCQVTITTDNGSQGEKGLVTQAVKSVLRSSTVEALYACGPVALLSALVLMCREEKVAAQLSWEANMRCGIGLCGSCELEEDVRSVAGIPSGWLTCKDGPVFIHS